MNQQQSRQMATDSQKRLDDIYDQEEAVSKAFQIDSFYTNERLNIQQLKQRLNMIKNKKIKSPSLHLNRDSQRQYNLSPEKQSPSRHVQTAKFAQDNNPGIIEDNKQILNQIKQKLNFNEYKSTKHAEKSTQQTNKIQPWNQGYKNNYRIGKQPRLFRYDTKSKTIYQHKDKRSYPSSPLDSLQSRVHSRVNKSRFEQNESKYSESSNQKSWDEWGMENKLIIHISSQLMQFQSQINELWQHYQLLSSILELIRGGLNKQKNIIVKYIEDVCSNRFQFIKSALQSLWSNESTKKQQLFLKRLKKTIVLSRLLQNLSIVFLSLEICFKRKADSHLINFIGYSSSNIIFIIRLLQLVYSIDESLKLKPYTKNILTVIQSFEVASYGAKVNRIGEIVIRVEQNNEIISIVQNKLCSKMDKDFQNIIVSFLKTGDLHSKPFLEYSHYIFEFLAFYLANLNVVGQFQAVQIVPAPYLSLSKQRTVVIQPWDVLFSVRGETTYLRAYSQMFLTQLSKYCNIVYWSDLMPKQVDDLLQKLPFGSRLYKYHCKYENQTYVKLLERLGTDLSSTIIIDRSVKHFKYNRDAGLELPWKCQKKDMLLYNLMQILRPALVENKPLRKCIQSVKSQLMGQNSSKMKFKDFDNKHYVYQEGEVSDFPRILPKFP